MANDDHIARLMKGVTAWNAWRDQNPTVFPDLIGADLSGWSLKGVNLSEANLIEASLNRASLNKANLIAADLRGAGLNDAELNRADLRGAKLGGATLVNANLNGADLSDANLVGAVLRAAKLGAANLYRVNLTEADLIDAHLVAANFNDANLRGVDLYGADLARADLVAANLIDARLFRANLRRANLSRANLTEADLIDADLRETNLTGAKLDRANLETAVLVNSDLTAADLTGCRMYGASAWGLKLDSATKQQNLIITPEDEPEITVDNIEVAQFVYLLLHNQKIRDVIDTIGKKGVLLLGRFTEGRIETLERLRTKLRELGFVPMVFNFDKPETKDFTETVRLLANLSHFVIVDITNPRSAPLELQAAVPDNMVPFVPILEEGQPPFAMFVDLQKYDRVLKPVIAYSSVDRLIEVLEDKIVEPAKAKFNELLARRTEQLRIEKV